MKVLHYIKDFSLTSETFIYDLLIALEKSKIENYILCKQRVIEDERPFPPDKVKILKTEKNNNTRKFFNIISKKPKYWNKNIEYYIKNLNPDIIHLHIATDLFEIIKLNEKKPVLISFHGSNILHSFKKSKLYHNRILKLSAFNNVFFTAPSYFLRNKLLNLGINDSQLFNVPNMINNLFFNQKKNHLCEQQKELIITNIGRLESVKGQEFLLKGFSLFSSKHPNAKLQIIGYGRLEEKLNKLADELGINEKVEFLGRVKHSKIPTILKNSDIYVQPSIRDEKNFGEETFGVALLEAITVGLPVIFTNTGGMKEVVGEALDKTAFMVEQKSPKQIAQKLSHIINNPEIFDMAKNIYAQQISDKFSEQKIVEEYKAIYRKIAKSE